MNAFLPLYLYEKNKREEAELENLTMDKDLLDKYEFKILSYYGVLTKSDNPEVISKILEEESLNGWELVAKNGEKIRFRRPREFKATNNSSINPYRTEIYEPYYIFKFISLVLIFMSIIFMFVFLVFIPFFYIIYNSTN
jgi:hypothetical protein